MERWILKLPAIYCKLHLLAVIFILLLDLFALRINSYPFLFADLLWSCFLHCVTNPQPIDVRWLRELHREDSRRKRAILISSIVYTKTVLL